MILGVGALTSIVGAIPALFDRGHTVEDIEHSLVVQTGVAASAFLIILVFGLAGMQRRADAGRSPWLVYWAMWAVLFTAGMMAIVLPSLSEHRLAVDLNARGVSVQAHVVRHFSAGCGKNGCVTTVDYSFLAGKGGGSFHGFSNEGNVSRHPNDEYQYALSTGTLPVLYDPENPNRSHVYWGDYIHRQAMGAIVSTPAKVFAIMLLFMIVLLAGMFYPFARATSAIRDNKNKAAV